MSEYFQGLKANQALRKGVRGIRGATQAELQASLSAAREGRKAAQFASKMGKGLTVASGVVAGLQAADRQLDLNAENRRIQDSNTSNYFRSLDEANALIAQFRRQRDCGALTQEEFLRKLETIHKAVQAANAAFEESESGRFRANVYSTVENGLKGVLDVLPGGSVVGNFFGWLAGNTFVVE
jgi:hypothetical protein